jgi:hypothetical protein
MQSTSVAGMLFADSGPGFYNGNGIWSHNNIFDSGGAGAAGGDGAYFCNNVFYISPDRQLVTGWWNRRWCVWGLVQSPS